MIGPKPSPRPLPKPKRLPKRKTVTIAAAFNCAGGIVMCADSKEIYPETVKYDAEKISATCCEFGTFIFTGATNDADVLVRAIQRLEEKVSSQQYALRRLPTNSEQPLLEDAIKEVMNEIRDDSILPWPADQQPWLSLLIGAAHRGVDVIYKATPRTIVRIDEHECVGVGILQAKALLDRLFDRNLSKLEMEVLAIYIMRLVKKYVPDVDGYTDVVSTDVMGRLKWWPSGKVIELEQKFAALDEYSKEILLRMCVMPGDPHERFKGSDLRNAGRILKIFRKDIATIATQVEQEHQAFLKQLSQGSNK